MNKKLLIFIDEGFSEENELSREAGMDPKELGIELEDLCRKGYLVVCENDSNGMCAAGPNLREDAGVGRKFSLTEKGKKLIFKSV